MNYETNVRQATRIEEAGLHRPWLRPFAGVLSYVARSALDLHRYRYMRTRMLHDSLRKQDCRRGVE